MSVKRKCSGCGAVFDFEFGTTVVCQFCGTKQYIAFNESTYERIKQANNYRESGEFDKCIDVYDNLIESYPKSQELRFGRFLAKYEVLNTERLLKGKEVVLTVCETSVEKDEDFILATSLNEENQNYNTIGSVIEKRRAQNVIIDNAIDKCCYLAMIISNGGAKEDFLAMQIYKNLCNKVDLFYPTASILSCCEEDMHVATLLACANVPCLYVVVEDLDKFSLKTKQIIEKFVEHNDFSKLSLITSDCKKANYFYKNAGNVIDFSYSADEDILDDLIVCAPIPFKDALQFKKTRKYLNNEFNPSPKIKI